MRSTLRKNVSLEGEDEIEDPKKRKNFGVKQHI